jgi:hypothetical protein
MRFHEIIREQASSQIGIATLLNAIYRRNQNRQNGEDNSKAALRAQWALLRRHLRFPLTVYRALSVPPSEIDWKRVGCSWTWDRDAAVVGGVLGNDDVARTILQATVTKAQTDIPATMWQFLTVYEEEKEVRLRPHMPIVITVIYHLEAGDKEEPPLPFEANTGDAMWDDEGLRREMMRAVG